MPKTRSSRSRVKARKPFIPEGGWNQENFAVYGASFIQNFVSGQKRAQKLEARRLKRWWQMRFKSQLDQVVGKVERRAKGVRIELEKKGDFEIMFGNQAVLWDNALDEVFDSTNLMTETIAGNLPKQTAVMDASYNSCKSLLGEATKAGSKPALRTRAIQIGRKITRINNTTRGVFQSAIYQSIKNGDTVAETAKVLRDKLPQLNRRIATIVRTEMGRAADEGAKQSIKESEVVTHSSVIGCESSHDHPMLGQNCNIENVPTAEIDLIEFHINHTGAWVPSRMKSVSEIMGNTEGAELFRENPAVVSGREDPTAFPSLPLDVVRAQGGSSHTMHTRGGIFNAPRQALHNEIVSESLEGVAKQKEKKMVVLGGGPASGKSTLTESAKFNKLVPDYKTKTVVVDPDKIKGKLPEYGKKSQIPSKEQAMFVHQESSVVSQRLVNEAKARDLDIVLDGTGNGNWEKLTKRLESYKSNGHKVVGHYCTLETKLAEKLAYDRGVKTGRFVPVDVIRKTHDHVSLHAIKAVQKGHYDEFYLWDTNVYKNPRKIFEYKNGQGKVLDKGLYKDFLLKSAENKKMYDAGQDLPFLKWKSDKVQFKEAKNISEAKAYTKELGVKKVQVEVGEESLDAINATNQSLTKIKNAGGDISDLTITFRDQTARHVADYNEVRAQLTINPRTYGNTKKQIKRVGDKAVEVGFWATEDIIVHEFGHHAHYLRSKEIDDMLFFKLKHTTKMTKAQQEIASRVSKYASSKPIEFIAETFNGLSAGIKYDAEVLALYEKWGGASPLKL